MKAILEVDKGANLGTKYEIDVRSYRALGRMKTAEQTVQLTKDGDNTLEPDDVKKVDEHLAGRTADDAPEPLRMGVFKRGRDIRLDDPGVSRTHAVLFMDEFGPSIVDLDSANGTHVNGKKVRDADLRDGDVVNIGKTRIVLRILSESAP